MIYAIIVYRVFIQYTARRIYIESARFYFTLGVQTCCDGRRSLCVRAWRSFIQCVCGIQYMLRARTQTQKNHHPNRCLRVLNHNQRRLCRFHTIIYVDTEWRARYAPKKPSKNRKHITLTHAHTANSVAQH